MRGSIVTTPEAMSLCPSRNDTDGKLKCRLHLQREGMGSRAWWGIPAISVPRRLRQEDCHKFEASQGYLQDFVSEKEGTHTCMRARAHTQTGREYE